MRPLECLSLPSFISPFLVLKNNFCCDSWLSLQKGGDPVGLVIIHVWTLSYNWWWNIKLATGSVNRGNKVKTRTLTSHTKKSSSRGWKSESGCKMLNYWSVCYQESWGKVWTWVHVLQSFPGSYARVLSESTGDSRILEHHGLTWPQSLHTQNVTSHFRLLSVFCSLCLREGKSSEGPKRHRLRQQINLYTFHISCPEIIRKNSHDWVCPKTLLW